MILRLPEQISERITHLMNGRMMEVTDLIEIEPFVDKNEDESRNMFRFKFGDFQSNASILDLPCVIESHKTVDDTNFYKCNNISQMIYVHPRGEERLEQVPGNEQIAKKQV